MTIANIKSNALRRTLLVVAISLLPIIIACIAFAHAVAAFIEVCKDQFGQGWRGVWEPVCDCWKGRK